MEPPFCQPSQTIKQADKELRVKEENKGRLILIVFIVSTILQIFKRFRRSLRQNSKFYVHKIYPKSVIEAHISKPVKEEMQKYKTFQILPTECDGG